MKKLFFGMLIGITALALVGCSMSSRGNTLQSKQFSPAVFATPTLAELNVSEKKVMGRATGRSAEKERLENAAVLDALKTNADVLVGASFFYEIINDVMSVIVIGYPASYKNFRPAQSSDIAGSQKTQNFILEASGTISKDATTQKVNVAVSETSVKTPQNAAVKAAPAVISIEAELEKTGVEE